MMTERVTLTPSSFADEAPAPSSRVSRDARRLGALDGSYELDESGELVEELTNPSTRRRFGPPELELDEDDVS